MGSARLGGCGGLYYSSVRCDPGWAPLGWEGVGLYYGSVRCDPEWALGWEGVAGCTMAVYAVTRGGL